MPCDVKASGDTALVNCGNSRPVDNSIRLYSGPIANDLVHLTVVAGNARPKGLVTFSSFWAIDPGTDLVVSSFVVDIVD